MSRSPLNELGETKPSELRLLLKTRLESVSKSEDSELDVQP